MKALKTTALAFIVLLSACGDTEEETPEVPQAKYPYTPPPLDDNPPMSSEDIDRINDEVMRGQEQ